MEDIVMNGDNNTSQNRTSEVNYLKNLGIMINKGGKQKNRSNKRII